MSSTASVTAAAAAAAATANSDRIVVHSDIVFIKLECIKLHTVKAGTRQYQMFALNVAATFATKFISFARKKQSGEKRRKKRERNVEPYGLETKSLHC